MEINNGKKIPCQHLCLKEFIATHFAVGLPLDVMFNFSLKMLNALNEKVGDLSIRKQHLLIIHPQNFVVEILPDNAPCITPPAFSQEQETYQTKNEIQKNTNQYRLLCVLKHYQQENPTSASNNEPKNQSIFGLTSKEPLSKTESQTKEDIPKLRENISFLSPEFLSEVEDPSDFQKRVSREIFAFGVVCYWLLTGKGLKFLWIICFSENSHLILLLSK